MGVPSVSKSPAVATEHSYSASIDASKTLVFTGRGNLYGFFFDNNDAASDVIVQFFNAAATGDVTVGTTSPDFEVRVPAGGSFGRDPNDSPYKFFGLGCVVAVTDARSGAALTASAASGQFWYVNH